MKKVACIFLVSNLTLPLSPNALHAAHETGISRKKDKPVVFNFHGYPQTVKSVLFNYAVDSTRFDVRGYKEIGSTTTPFDMHVRNETSRYDLAIAAFRQQKHQAHRGFGG